MKVIDKRNIEFICFGDLQSGDVFEWGGEYYVVIPHILDCETDSHYNVFSLYSNLLDHFENDIEVIKVRAEIIIT